MQRQPLITIAILLSVLNIQIIYVIIHQILLPDLKEIDPWALPYDITFMILSTLAIASPAIVYESLRLWSLERNKRLILDQENRDFKEKFESRTEFLTVQSRGKTYRIPIKDVLYIESFGDYSHIHLSDRKVISRITLKELERLSKKFLRIHRSYIANSDHCKAFNNNEVINNIKIPVGRSYKRNISKLFM